MRKKIAILTSSRADYSIYYPLIKRINEDINLELNIIAFGSHFSEKHGNTFQNIINDGFDVALRIDSEFNGDNPIDIANYIGNTILKFGPIWQSNTFDLAICLGDRFEMFAAVASGVPFNVNFAHLYGGETTLGAIDNSLRHSISHFSKLHFTSCEAYKNRVVELIGDANNVYNIGALSYDNFNQIELPEKSEFLQSLGMDSNKEFILTTFHPETIDFEKNQEYIEELCKAIEKLNTYNFLITMPNADTNSQIIRDTIDNLKKSNPHVYTSENLGTVRYLAAIKHCALMLGNTSSGFVEAAYFPTKVVNLGNRQLGRILTPNIINSDINCDSILQSIAKAESLNISKSDNIYGNGNAAEKAIGYIYQYLGI
jgi:GDP/UDP-N,N'-diacetylbacillosamine 2-epimerase (hydrolysing)